MTKDSIGNIVVMTSGGDAPGMNAAIRAVTRTGVYYRLKVVGIRHGYEGMIHGHFKELKAYSVSDIIQRGGTILKTARSKAFRTVEGRRQAYEKLKAEGIDARLLQAFYQQLVDAASRDHDKDFQRLAVGVAADMARG